MTITRRQLDSEYAEWFRGMRHAEEAKREILELFGTEPDEDHTWTEQDLGPRRHFPTGSRLQAAMAVEKSRRELVRLLS